ncbi:MAG: hypothetical protein PHE79_03325 [Eubacteriales bacterium]|nr:hypothetical protein [Eubacteriales bacterium]
MYHNEEVISRGTAGAKGRIGGGIDADKRKKAEAGPHNKQSVTSA